MVEVTVLPRHEVRVDDVDDDDDNVVEADADDEGGSKTSTTVVKVFEALLVVAEARADGSSLVGPTRARALRRSV